MFYLMCVCVYIYMCVCVHVIKVEDYVTFLYEGSMYTRYLYDDYMEVYVKLLVELRKVLNFLLNSTYECDNAN